MNRFNTAYGYKQIHSEPNRSHFIQLVLLAAVLVVAGASFFYLLQAEGEPGGMLQNQDLSSSPNDSVDADPKVFPPGFMIGCASSAYQAEGAWNVDGKGESNWDHMIHTNRSKIVNNDTADVACDSYHKYKEDVRLIKDIGFNHYRFSISWSRVMPTGHDDKINAPGIAYYHSLIDELLAHGIEPMVTLFHWDLPQPLEELGGWANPLMADYFETYAGVMFKQYASKVKWWVTINEPRHIMRGYGPEASVWSVPPNILQDGVADYLAVHTLLRAHAKAYLLYDREFRPLYGGKISIVLDSAFLTPKTNSTADQAATERSYEFQLGLFAHPIYSKEGDYPRIVREIVDHNSQMEGRSQSRLPRFNEEEVEEIRGSSDFFALNHYSSSLVSDGVDENQPDPSFLRDSRAIRTADPLWPTAQSPWLKVTPWGMRGILNYIRKQYDNPPIFITENGYSTSYDSGTVDDKRIKYYHDYLEQMLVAMNEDDCNVIGYTAWSILDNFEWNLGYSERFGICYVNFSDPERPRTKKLSAEFFKKLMEGRKLPDVDSLLKTQTLYQT